MAAGFYSRYPSHTPIKNVKIKKKKTEFPQYGFLTSDSLVMAQLEVTPHLSCWFPAPNTSCL